MFHVVRSIVRIALALLAIAVPGAWSQDRALDACAEAGLDWLVRHQDADGHWSAAAFDEQCPESGSPCDGLAQTPVHDVGVTGLAVLAILSSPDGSALHAEALGRALDWLTQRQVEEGSFANVDVANHTYDHAVATLAVAEAVVLAQRADMRVPLTRAVDYLHAMRTEASGWRYAEFHPEMLTQTADVSVTAWAVLALIAADRAKVAVREVALADGLLFLREMSDDDTDRTRAGFANQVEAEKATLALKRAGLKKAKGTIKAEIEKQIERLRQSIKHLDKQRKTATASGRVGYFARGGQSARLADVREHFPGEKTEACTAAALASRLALSSDARRMDEGAALLLERCLAMPPSAKDPEGFDAYYWYYGSTAVAHPLVKSADAKRWRRALGKTLETLQEEKGCVRGSFDPAR